MKASKRCAISLPRRYECSSFELYISNMPRPIESFSGQRVYVDICDGNCRRNLEETLRRLGAVVHVFLMENVNIIITDNITKYGTSPKLQSLRNPRELCSFGSHCVESKEKIKKHTNKSFGSYSDLTSKGTLRIMSLDETQRHINHLTKKVPGGERYLKSPFIKADFIDGHYCPIFKEFIGSWPALKVNISNCSNAVSPCNLPNISSQKPVPTIQVQGSIKKEVKSIKKSGCTRICVDNIDERMSYSNGLGVENFSSSKCSTQCSNAQFCSNHTACISWKLAISEKCGVASCLFNNFTKLLLSLHGHCREKLSHPSSQHQLCGQISERHKYRNDSCITSTKVKRYLMRNNTFKMISSDPVLSSLVQDIVLQIIRKDFKNFHALFVHTSLVLITSNILQEMMKFMKLRTSPWRNAGNMLQNTILHETRQTVCYKSIVKVCVERRNFPGSRVAVFEKPKKRTIEKSVPIETSDYTKFMKLKPNRKRMRDLWMEHSEDSLLKRCKYDNELGNLAHSEKLQIQNRNNIFGEKEMQYKGGNVCDVQNRKPCVMKFHDLQSSKILNKGMISENVFNPAPNVPGYCEICKRKCVSIRKHIEELTHTTFFLDNAHFQVLDRCISTVNSSSIFKTFGFSGI